MSVFFYK